VTEVDFTLRRWLGPAAGRAFLAAITDGTHDRVVLSETIWRRAVAIDARYADLNLGLADTSVMALAEERQLPVFTFDFRAFRAVRGPGRDGSWPLVVSESDLPR